jgi:hypothetical protein
MKTSIIKQTGLEQKQNKMLLFLSSKKVHLSEFNRQFYNI